MDAFLTADGLIALAHAHISRSRTRRRQRHFHFDPDRPAAAPISSRAHAGIGLLGAMGMRILLLLSITWIMRLTQPLFTAFGHAFSGRDLILISGGIFLLWKATMEIHDKLEGEEEHGAKQSGAIIRRRHRSDHAPRHHLLARLGHHRRRHGQRYRDHDRGRRRRRGHHDVLGQADRRLRRAAIRP